LATKTKCLTYIKNVLEATKILQQHPDDLDARGTIMMGASLSTSSRLGIGKEETFAYDIYELEFLPEKLFGSSYRRSLTSIFPKFLCAMGKHHPEEVGKYYLDAFGFDSSIEDSSRKLAELFSGLGVEMYYNGQITREQVDAIPCHTELSKEEVFGIINSLIR
jgi:alcohol dehydrogenase YqhD (iron-dependent ADH family)